MQVEYNNNIISHHEYITSLLFFLDILKRYYNNFLTKYFEYNKILKLINYKYY